MRCSIGGQKRTFKTKPGLSFPKIDEIFESNTWGSAGVRREEDQVDRLDHKAGMVCGGGLVRYFLVLLTSLLKGWKCRCQL